MNHSKTKESLQDRCYIFFVVLSLVMYVFGHSTEWGQLPFPDKLFYVPCVITMVIATSSPKYWKFTSADKFFIAFWTLAFITTTITVKITFETIFNSLIGFLIFRHLVNVNYKVVIELLLYVCPLVVAIHYVYSNPLALSLGYRYGGFQGDPNCFSFAINVFVFACGYILSYSLKAWKKIWAVGCILSILPLLFSAASRANVAITALILLAALMNILKRNKLVAFIILILITIGGGRYFSRFSTQIETVSGRYEATEGGSEYRTQEFSIVPSLLLAHPQYILYGIGYNESIHAHARFPREYYHKGRAHNSYMSVLLEEGVLGFILFMGFFYQKGKVIWRNRNKVDGKYNLVMFFCLLLFFYTINCLPFLPFWFIVNLISSPSSQKHLETIGT